METITLFFWPRELNNSFNFGAQATFHADHRVSYTNYLMPPGKVIHHWDSSGQLVSLPLLANGKQYHFEFAGITAPDKMFSQVVYLDQAGQELKKEEFDSLGGDIQLPDGANNYRIQLVNIRQTGTEFGYGLLSTPDIFQQMTISVEMEAGMMRLQYNNQADSQDLVVVSHRFGALSVLIATDRSTIVVYASPAPNQVQRELQPDVPIRMRLLGPGLIDQANDLRQALAPSFTFLDSEVDK